MGSDERENEKPIHEVIVLAFQIGKYPVTQAQYQAVMGNNPSRFSGNPQNPVETVTWFDAQKFCEELSKLTGNNYRLPTEAEYGVRINGIQVMLTNQTIFRKMAASHG